MRKNKKKSRHFFDYFLESLIFGLKGLIFAWLYYVFFLLHYDQEKNYHKSLRNQEYLFVQQILNQRNYLNRIETKLIIDFINITTCYDSFVWVSVANKCLSYSLDPHHIKVARVNIPLSRAFFTSLPLLLTFFFNRAQPFQRDRVIDREISLLFLFFSSSDG